MALEILISLVIACLILWLVLLIVRMMGLSPPVQTVIILLVAIIFLLWIAGWLPLEPPHPIHWKP